MKFADIDPVIRGSLRSKGFNSIRSSNTRKTVLEFERNKNSTSIFEIMYDKPILRVLIQLLVDNLLEGALTLEQASNVIRKTPLMDTLSESPIKTLYCKRCTEAIHSYRVYEEDKPTGEITCPICHRRNAEEDWVEKDDWTLSLDDSKHYLDQLSDSGFCFSRRLGTCFNCLDSQAIELLTSEEILSRSKAALQEYVFGFYCRKCKRLYDVTQAYFIEEDVRGLWRENGTWLEWYLKNIIRKHLPDAHLDQGLLLRKDRSPIQVDLIVVKEEKLMSFQCKAKKPAGTVGFKEVADLLKWRHFSDEIFLVTTGRLRGSTERSLRDVAGNKLKIVEGPAIERIFL